MRTDASESIPEGTKIKVDQKVLVQVLEDCWDLLVETQRVKQLIDDKMKGMEQRDEPHPGWYHAGPSLMDYGVPPEIANDLNMMLWDMGEHARLALVQILSLRKAALDKPAEPNV